MRWLVLTLFMKGFGVETMTEKTGKYKSFIIHLQRSTGRNAQVQDLISKSPFEAEIVDAVDGAKLTQEEINACFSKEPLLQPKYPFVLNPGEIGCFQSHRRAWQKIVDQDLTAGLILEDDVQIDPEVFGPALEAAKKWSEKFGFIQFQVREVSPASQFVVQIDDHKLLRPMPTLLRCSAQLINKATAERLLEITQRFDRPVDTLLQMNWVTGVWPVCLVPSGVSDRTQETGGSTLSQKQPLKAKFARELKRARYRAQVKRYSKSAVLSADTEKGK